MGVEINNLLRSNLMMRNRVRISTGNEEAEVKNRSEFALSKFTQLTSTRFGILIYLRSTRHIFDRIGNIDPESIFSQSKPKSGASNVRPDNEEQLRNACNMNTCTEGGMQIAFNDLKLSNAPQSSILCCDVESNTPFRMKYSEQSSSPEEFGLERDMNRFGL
jgi:hypothetical protein